MLQTEMQKVNLPEWMKNEGIAMREQVDEEFVCFVAFLGLNPELRNSIKLWPLQVEELTPKVSMKRRISEIVLLFEGAPKDSYSEKLVCQLIDTLNYFKLNQPQREFLIKFIVLLIDKLMKFDRAEGERICKSGWMRMLFYRLENEEDLRMTWMKAAVLLNYETAKYLLKDEWFHLVKKDICKLLSQGEATDELLFSLNDELKLIRNYLDERELLQVLKISENAPLSQFTDFYDVKKLI
ncbi:hypothetical protein Ciccas_007658 [Cichlidogyrus casuarinus]|uniref:Uncharacterized protein n=1 Tax=Cichlidogyrus casuarinus TaxID=1844966 RepID=A0ABD2Q317_9PLAT